MSAPCLKTLAWRIGRNYTTTRHLVDMARPTHTLCERPIPRTPLLDWECTDGPLCVGCCAVADAETAARLGVVGPDRPTAA